MILYFIMGVAIGGGIICFTTDLLLGTKTQKTQQPIFDIDGHKKAIEAMQINVPLSLQNIHRLCVTAKRRKRLMAKKFLTPSK